LYSELIADRSRNRLICDEVLQTVTEGRTPLILTERNEHLDALAEQLSPGVRNLFVFGSRCSEPVCRTWRSVETDAGSRVRNTRRGLGKAEMSRAQVRY
jgi:hypothetical protein